MVDDQKERNVKRDSNIWEDPITSVTGFEPHFQRFHPLSEILYFCLLIELRQH
jgi:hypothetical protein